MRFYVDRNSDGLWWWRLELADGTVIAVSGEAYRAKHRCNEMIEIVKSSEEAEVFEATGI